MQASSPTVAATPLLRASHLCKRFAGVQALREVSLEVVPGEVLAVIGENGAGKSTLMKILSGVLQPNSGSIVWEGQELTFRSPADAIDQGISLIHQELNLVDNLSVAENLFLGREPHRLGWIQRKRLIADSRQYLDQVGLQVDPAKSLGLLSIAEKQRVEIAKAVATGARLLIMDEPTSSLSSHETERLFTLVDTLRMRGTSILYISHRLAEVIRLADRVEVLRDGRHVASMVGEAITHDAMVRAMVGRDPRSLLDHTVDASGPLRLSVRDLRVEGTVADVNLEVRGRQIVVLAGLVGAGRSELLETIFGLRTAEKGNITVDEKPLRGGRVREAIAAGLALVSEDRKSSGLHLESSVTENITIASLPCAPAAPRIDPRWEAQQAQRQVQSLAIKTASLGIRVASLSGGNQQKIAIAKWLVDPPKVLLLDEPTRGVDVGARHEIYLVLRRLADAGMAILIVSSDLEEVIAIADRVLVMHEHAIRGELNGAAINEPQIMNLAVGGEAHLSTT